MINPNMTVGEAISSVRDLAFIVGTLTFGWKARDWFQPVFDFFKRANHHMDFMESSVNVLLTNHMAHIQADLEVIAGRSSET